MTDATAPDHIVTLPDGRQLAVDVRGPDEGPAVVLCHPIAGSRRLDPDPEITRAAGIRLLTIDRPSYGGSTPLPAGTVPTITGHADDVAAALDQLEISEAGVAGWSAGGRVALVLAIRRPDLVRAVAVVATPAPDEDVPWIPEEFRVMIARLRQDPPSATAQIAAALAGQAADPAATRARASLFYGDADAITGPAHGEWYAARIPNADIRVVPDAGHLVALTAWDEIVAAVRPRSAPAPSPSASRPPAESR
jgi:pimeloyl-ACP methyl ester carboxylesterase